MYRIGIDIGGSKVSVGLVNESLTITAKAKFNTNASAGKDDISYRILNTIFGLLKDTGIPLCDVKRIGIGAPGIVDVKNKIVKRCTNLFDGNWDIASKVKSETNIQTFIDNDANCATFGEYIAGCAVGLNNVVGVTIGTGIGCGIIIDGKIYRGYNFMAGELGHMVINYNTNKCGCGRYGCFETFASASALIKQTKMAVNNDECEHSLIKDMTKKYEITGKTAFCAMKKGDKLASSIVNRYIDYLSCGIANIINILSPQLLFIGGGISHEEDFLIKPLKLKVERELLSSNTRLCTAKLKNDAGIIGAAYIVTD